VTDVDAEARVQEAQAEWRDSGASSFSLPLVLKWRASSHDRGSDSGPARGALLELVRARRGDPFVVTTVVDGRWSVLGFGPWPTELDALVIAFERAGPEWHPAPVV
jgi:hypothetical protein